jgi:RHS repeat-associated protein
MMVGSQAVTATASRQGGSLREGYGSASISGHVDFTGSAWDPNAANSVELWEHTPSIPAQDMYLGGSIDANGDFTITGVGTGSYTLEFLFLYYDLDCACNLASHQYWGGGASPASATYFGVTNGSSIVLSTSFVPASTSSISGKITDAGGNPLHGFAIAWDATWSSPKLWNVTIFAESRADGTYTLPHLVSGDYRIGFMVAEVGYPYNLSTGALGVSNPFVSQWYGNTASYSASTIVTVGGSVLSGIDAVMGFGFPASPPAGAWQLEVVGASNPSENYCQCGHADPVNSATGEFYLAVTDVSLPGVGPDVAITRNYSSAISDREGAFGYGWASALDMRVEIIDTGGPGAIRPLTVAVVQENGSTVLFTDDGFGTYQPPNPRARASLSWTGSEWKFVRRSKETFYFDAVGRMSAVADLNQNEVVAEYDEADAIDGLFASGDRAVTLTWADGHVVQAEDSAGRSVDYEYDSGGNLIEVAGVDGAVVAYGYDLDHRITTVTKPGGATTTNVYDSSQRVTSQTDPLGRTTTFAYGVDSTTVTRPSGAIVRDRYFRGQLVTQTIGADSPAAATTYYTYDDSANLRRVQDPLGHTVTYSYDSHGNQTGEVDGTRATSRVFNSSGNPTYITDPMGLVTHLIYDAHENLTQVTNPGGAVQSWTYNSDGTISTSTDGEGNASSYSYDDAGRRIETTDPLGHTSTVSYDSAGHITSTTDGEGNVTVFTVDDAGRALTSTDAEGNATTYVYDGRGNLLMATDALSRSVASTYDLADQLTSVTDALGKVTSYAYTPDGLPLTTTDPNGHVTTRAYDVRGNEVSVQDPLAHTTSQTYDLADNLVQVTSPAGAVTTYTYNEYDELVKSTDALGKYTDYGYDADGRVTWIGDPLGRTTWQDFDADGRLTSVTYPDSSAALYVYDSRGLLTEFTNADGLVTTYDYDDAGRMVGKTEPGGMLTSYAYDDANRLLVTTRPDGSTSTRGYDRAGRLTSVDESASGASDTTYVYDAAGQRISMIDGTGTTSYTYTARGQLAAATNGAGLTIGYAYDDAGQLTSLAYPGSKVVTYAYDDAGNMSSVTDWNTKTTSYTWTADDLLSTQTGPNSITSTRLYDAVGRTTSITVKKGSTQVAKYGYTYNAAGEVVGDTTSDPTSSSLAHTYAYDPLGQIKSTKTGSTTRTYTATPAHAITKTANGDIYTYNGLQQLVTLAPSSGASTTFTYDDNGSRLSSAVASATTTYGYTAAAGLASVSISGSSPASVAYTSDGDGLRQTRTRSGVTTEFLWDTNAAVPTLLSDGAQWYVYGATSTPVEQIGVSSGTTLYLQGDLVGSVRLMTASTGSTAGATAFDAFGPRTAHTGSSDSSIGFAAGWTDSVTGLVYMRARDYDPKTSQFLTVDPAVDLTRDPYAYVVNDPLRRVDPLGLSGDPLYDFLTTGWTGEFSNFLVGFGDGASFGLTHLITNALFPDVVCEITESSWYVPGQVTGGIATTLATAGAGSGGSALALGRSGLAAGAENGGMVFGQFGAAEIRAAAATMDRNGLTQVGRALQKHSGRSDSVFGGLSSGSAATRNEQGMRVLDEIMNDPGARTEILDSVTNIWDSAGRGIRLGNDGTFMGFLEPRA